jgi:hypothetical protein
MHSFIPQKIQPGLRYFQFSCVFLLVAIVALIADNRYNIVNLSWWLELPIMVYYFWSAFYMIMFAARMLESAIEGELVNRSDSFSTFLYIGFTPFGLWSIQKKVQRVLASKNVANF